MTGPIESVRLEPTELESIDSFRRRKDTAVLTVMFTDIVGFTELTDQRGEVFSNEIRHLHDEVLDRAITEDGAGLVVKHIGDAVMAVFAEPSTAVERALRIHAGLAELSASRPDIDSLEVKIGLDMGQVTVEEQVDTDVFGRHVNRASRVEGLAAGGQVFMTFSVFDSARGWLSTPKNESLEWASHGRYRLKGVSAPVEIFEVADTTRGALKPPRRGERVRSVPGVAAAAALVLVGVVGTLAYGQFQSTELWLAQYAPPLSYLDGVELRLDGEQGDNERMVLTEVRSGRHILHYDVADMVRFYAELDLERGENHIRPDFEESRIPTVSRYGSLGEAPEEGTREGSYFFFDESAERVTRAAEMAISVGMEEAGAPNGDHLATFAWSLTLDGEEVASGERGVARAGDEDERFEERFEIHSDDYHTYSVYMRVIRTTPYLEITADFKPPA